MAEQIQAEVFEAILASVREGLSLRQAAALQDVPHARLSAWILLADRGREPWAEFLLLLTKQDAGVRAEVLKDLGKIALVDNAARRDMCRQLGTASPLERELDQLRRMPDVVPDEGDDSFSPRPKTEPWNPELEDGS